MNKWLEKNPKPTSSESAASQGESGKGKGASSKGASSKGWMKASNKVGKDKNTSSKGEAASSSQRPLLLRSKGETYAERIHEELMNKKPTVWRHS